MKKKLLALLLACSMVMSVAPAAFAEDAPTITTVAELQTAVDAAADGAVITVGQILYVRDSETVELDLKGKTVNLVSIYNSGVLTVKNGTLVGTSVDESVIETSAGSLTLEDVTASGPRHVIRVKGGEVTINSGSYSVMGTAGMTTHVVNASAGTVTINAGSFKGVVGTAGDSGTTVLAQGTANVIINGGDFSGASNGYGDEPVTAVSPATITVMGGTFDLDPSNYLADGYEYDADTCAVTKSWYDPSAATLTITNAEELLAFAAAANAGDTFSGKKVVLAANIDLDGMTWTPIASFAGEFDGGSHTISNFHIDDTASSGGFFKTIEAGEGERVHDLTLSDITATVGAYRFGTLANSVKGIVNRVTVKNVTVTTTNTAAWVGGMCAFMSWPWMNDCTVENLTVNAEAGADLIGGFSCILQKNSNMVFENNDVKGVKVAVTDTDSSGCGVGGFVTQTQRGWEFPKIINSDITGIDVTASGLVDVGGFIAWPGAHTTVENCTTEGTIDVTDVTSADCFAGGFFGNLGWNCDLGQKGHVVTNCSADVDIITKIAPAGGFVGSATNSNDRSMYAEFYNCSASGDVTCVEEGTADIGGFAGDADRGVYDGCIASGTVTNNGTGHAGQFIGAVYDVNPSYDGRYPAGTRDYLADEIGLTDCTYNGTSELLFIGNTEEGTDVTVATSVASVTDSDSNVTKYTTLQAALDAAADMHGSVTIKLIGDHSTTNEINIPADKKLTIDASAANFGVLENVKVKIGRIVDSTNEFENGKSGEYTLTGFKLNGSLSVGTSATTLTVSDCELEALDLNASNSTVIVEGNKINSTSGNKRFDGGNSDFGLYVYADQIDLTVKNNEIEAVDSAIVVQGNWPYFLSGENSISIFDNELRTEEGNIFSTWNFNTYAPVEWPDEYQITGEMKTLTKQIIEKNDLTGMCEKDIVKVLCRANGMSDISVTEKHELLKDVADMSGLHSWGDWEVTKYPTMYAEGEETRYCTVDGCDGYETRTLAKLPYVPANPVDPAYTITVEDADNGSIKVSTSRASKGQTVTITVTPDAGYTLETLTVLNQNGKEVELTKKSDSKYTFKMPASKVTVYATFMEDNTILNYFTDVFASDYYYDAVLWAVENGITNGTSATTFSPDAVCTRAQVVTFLWRAAGSPEPKSAIMPFTDVAANAYYYNAVLWAVENGITNGTSATTFSPNADCTRGQIVTFLWRSQGSENATANNPFVDVADGAYYEDAVLWAVENDITNGTGVNTFSPDADCTRAQIVTFLWRCLNEQ